MKIIPGKGKCSVAVCQIPALTGFTRRSISGTHLQYVQPVIHRFHLLCDIKKLPSSDPAIEIATKLGYTDALNDGQELLPTSFVGCTGTSNGSA